MASTDIELQALQIAFATLVQKLESVGAIPAGEVAQEISARGTNLVMSSHLDTTQAFGRAMADLAQRMLG